jgi:hypothetical protein
VGTAYCSLGASGRSVVKRCCTLLALRADVGTALYQHRKYLCERCAHESRAEMEDGGVLMRMRTTPHHCARRTAILSNCDPKYHW